MDLRRIDYDGLFDLHTVLVVIDPRTVLFPVLEGSFGLKLSVFTVIDSRTVFLPVLEGSLGLKLPVFTVIDSRTDPFTVLGGFFFG